MLVKENSNIAKTNNKATQRKTKKRFLGSTNSCSWTCTADQELEICWIRLAKTMRKGRRTWIKTTRSNSWSPVSCCSCWTKSAVNCEPSAMRGRVDFDSNSTEYHSAKHKPICREDASKFKDYRLIGCLPLFRNQDPGSCTYIRVWHGALHERWPDGFTGRHYCFGQPNIALQSRPV